MEDEACEGIIITNEVVRIDSRKAEILKKFQSIKDRKTAETIYKTQGHKHFLRLDPKRILFCDNRSEDLRVLWLDVFLKEAAEEATTAFECVMKGESENFLVMQTQKLYIDSQGISSAYEAVAQLKFDELVFWLNLLHVTPLRLFALE